MSTPARTSAPPPSPRPVIATIPRYVPGRAHHDEAHHDGTTVPVAKLSSNEVPTPPTAAVLEAIARAGPDLNRYPDLLATELVEAIAARYDLDPARVVAGTGSVALLYHLLEAFCEPGDEVVYAWRSFEAYPIALALPSAVAVPVPLTQDHRHDVDAMVAAVTAKTRVVMVCTPNNPTGPAVTAGELDRLMAGVPEHVVVVVDEAYAEFVTDPAAANGFALVEDHPNLVVLRTFSKAYSLAGARVGYLVAHPEVAAAVRAAAFPFGINTLARVAALAALADEPSMRTRVAAVVGERDRVLVGVRRLGYPVPDSQANFCWLPVGEQAVALSDHFGRVGVIVRPFAGDGIRVSIGTPAENDRMLEALAEWDGVPTRG